MASSSAPIAVLVLEDQPKLRQSLALLLDGSPGFACVGACADANAALKSVARTKPDVVTVDLELPGTSGTEFLRECRRRFPGTELLVLTVHDQPQWVFPALAAGASGYLLKGTPPAKLLEAITEIHAGSSWMSGPVARLVLESFQVPASEPATAEPLSRREQEVMALLARGLRYVDIAHALSISRRTVNTHLYHVYRKLHVHSAAGAVGRLMTHGVTTKAARPAR